MSWSPCGRWIAAPSRDAVVHIWDIERGFEVGRLKGHKDVVYCAEWSPDGNYIASASWDGTLRVWDVVDTSYPNSVVVIETSGYGNALAWSPVDNTLALGTEGRAVTLWDPLTGARMGRLTGHLGNVNNLAWSPDGQALAAASGDKTVRIWDAATNQLAQTLAGHHSWVFDVAWDASGEHLFSASWDMTVRRWHVATGRLLNILEGHSERISSISLSPDGRLLATKSLDDSVRLWDGETLQPLGALAESSSGRFSPNLRFHAKLPLLATLAERDRTIRVWGVRPGEAPGIPRYYRNARVVLVGDSGVGKSALGLVLSGRPFQLTESTHGRRVLPFAAYEESEETREILLWDLAGQPAYRLVHQLSLNEVSVALVVFDARSETEPFAGVRYWDLALTQAKRREGENSVPMTKFLVAARADRGGTPASSRRIQAIVDELGFRDHFETSAKEGWQIDELTHAIPTVIDWDVVPKVTSNAVFQAIREFLLREHENGRLLSTTDELCRGFQTAQRQFAHREDLDSEFSACLGRMESRGLVRRLSFGGYILLQPALLDAYASSLINAARAEPDGLGSIPEEAAVAGDFTILPEFRIRDKHQDKLLLIATVEELLGHEIAFRETTDRGVDLVFPSQFTCDRPLTDEIPGSVVFEFEGPVVNVYATLAVRLSHSIVFRRQQMWRNASEFSASVGGTCRISVQEVEEGRGRLSLSFDEHASEPTRFQFEEYVRTHLERRAASASVRRDRIYRCPECDEMITASQAKRRRERGFDVLPCPVCETPISLADREQRLPETTPTEPVTDMDQAADRNRDFDVAAAKIRGKIETEDYDVFLCHNADDKEEVRQIAEKLKQRGVLPWLDEESIRGGEKWRQRIADQIQVIPAVCVLLGATEMRHWQEWELDLAIKQTEERRCRLIPVLLASSAEKTPLPALLEGYQVVDFRKPTPDPLKQLVWAITGERAD
jgi:WD40 repeat protein